jgi:thiamine biosynthesis lipoprotein
MPPADVLTLNRCGADYLATFRAMATPCEVRIETADPAEARAAAEAAEAEARRIETKFSRYRNDSVVGRINAGAGQDFEVDAETAHLLDFADHCFRLSGGLFDVTSGVLRRIWRFDGSDRVPDNEQIRQMRELVGWQRVSWKPPFLCLAPGMEIDFGGLAKEYAVDRALAAVRRVTDAPSLVNFGGDLCVSGPRRIGSGWKVAIESVDKDRAAAGLLELSSGAIATSGDARRYLLKDGKRYGHILDPRTCRPVEQAPRSVTVAAQTCVEAGLIATLAILQGKGAEKFLKREGMRAWCIR